eukprot:scaffold4636_cov43-Attheya_sp.AAC.2
MTRQGVGAVAAVAFVATAGIYAVKVLRRRNDKNEGQKTESSPAFIKKYSSYLEVEEAIIEAIANSKVKDKPAEVAMKKVTNDGEDSPEEKIAMEPEWDGESSSFGNEPTDDEDETVEANDEANVKNFRVAVKHVKIKRRIEPPGTGMKEVLGKEMEDEQTGDKLDITKLVDSSSDDVSETKMVLNSDMKDAESTNDRLDFINSVEDAELKDLISGIENLVDDTHTKEEIRERPHYAKFDDDDVSEPLSLGDTNYDSDGTPKLKDPSDSMTPPTSPMSLNDEEEQDAVDKQEAFLLRIGSVLELVENAESSAEFPSTLPQSPGSHDDNNFTIETAPNMSIMYDLDLDDDEEEKDEEKSVLVPGPKIDEEEVEEEKRVAGPAHKRIKSL